MKFFIVTLFVVFLVLGLTCRADVDDSLMTNNVEVVSSSTAKSFLADDVDGKDSIKDPRTRVRRHGWEHFEHGHHHHHHEHHHGHHHGHHHHHWEWK